MHHVLRPQRWLPVPRKRQPPRKEDSEGQVTVLDGVAGNPIKMSGRARSSFTQSEYLLYKESQVILRYVLKMRM